MSDQGDDERDQDQAAKDQQTGACPSCGREATRPVIDDAALGRVVECESCGAIWTEGGRRLA